MEQPDIGWLKVSPSLNHLLSASKASGKIKRKPRGRVRIENKFCLVARIQVSGIVSAGTQPIIKHFSQCPLSLNFLSSTMCGLEDMYKEPGEKTLQFLLHRPWSYIHELRVHSSSPHEPVSTFIQITHLPYLFCLVDVETRETLKQGHQQQLLNKNLNVTWKY